MRTLKERNSGLSPKILTEENLWDVIFSQRHGQFAQNNSFGSGLNGLRTKLLGGYSYEGEFSSSGVYAKEDVVLYNGELYVCTNNKETPSNTTPNNDTSHFTKMTSGYIKLWNGLIVQWGKKTDSSSSGDINLPTKFSSTNYVVLTNTLWTSGDAVITPQPYNLTVSKFSYKQWYRGSGSSYGGANEPFFWVAIGF